MRPPRKSHLWIETAKHLYCSYCGNMEALNKDFGAIKEGDQVRAMPPLYVIEVHKCIPPTKIPCKYYEEGYRIKSTERIDRMYMFDTAALYRMAYWLAKHYREQAGGGTIERCQPKGIIPKICKSYGEWNLRVMDKEGNKRYIVSVEPVCQQIFQPIFDK